MVQNGGEINAFSLKIGRFSQGVNLHSALAQAVCQSLSELDVHTTKVSHGSLDDKRGGVTQTSDHVLHQSLSSRLVESLFPEGSGLSEVVLVLRIVTVHISAHGERRRTGGRALLRAGEAVWIIIWRATVIVYRHGAVSLVVHRGNCLQNFAMLMNTILFQYIRYEKLTNLY